MGEMTLIFGKTNNTYTLKICLRPLGVRIRERKVLLDSEFFLLKQCDTCIRVFFSQRKPCQLHQCKHDQVFLTSSYLSQIHVIHCFGYFIGRWTYEHYETRKIPTSTVNFSVYISGNTRSVSKLKLFHLLCVQIV